MDKQLVKQFFDQTNMRNEVFTYIKLALDEMLLKDGYSGEDTKGYKHANDLLIKVQQKMLNDFTVKDTRPKPPRQL